MTDKVNNMENVLTEAGWVEVGGGDGFTCCRRPERPTDTIYLYDDTHWERYDFDTVNEDVFEQALASGDGIESLREHLEVRPSLVV